jgi:hypothetical protein
MHTLGDVADVVTAERLLRRPHDGVAISLPVTATARHERFLGGQAKVAVARSSSATEIGRRHGGLSPNELRVMRIHPGRTALAFVALAEIGAVTGALLCWLLLCGWLFLTYGSLPRAALGPALLWAMMAGVPLGAVALPILGLGLMRRTPLGRALGYPFLGALLGVLAGAALSPGPATARVPLLVPALVAAGVALGVAVARFGSRQRSPIHVDDLPSQRRSQSHVLDAL